MKQAVDRTMQWSVTICVVSYLVSHVTCVQVGDTQLVYQWTALDITWPAGQEGEYIDNDVFDPHKNVIAGVKVYKGQVYLTVPRWRTNSGIPVTLGKVAQKSKSSSSAGLQAYPNMSWQNQSDCDSLQYVQSMEVDPNTGLMYVIDTGRVGLVSDNPSDLCPAEIVIFDLNTDEHVASYPLESVNQENNFINDIVLDYIDGEVRYAYITDVGDTKLHVFDFQTKKSWSIQDHDSMNPEPGKTSIHINGGNFSFNTPIDGIAMTPSFDFVFFCPLGATSLYQIPTTSLRKQSKEGIKLVGQKRSQTDGMVFSLNNRLFYGSLEENAVYSWEYHHGDSLSSKTLSDQTLERKTLSDQTVETKTLSDQTLVSRNDSSMQWPDTFALDEEGWLWFVSNRLHLFMADQMNFTSDESNMRVWRVFVNETSYLHGADQRSKVNNSGVRAKFGVVLMSLCICMVSLF